jgi:hypothetical protein
LLGKGLMSGLKGTETVKGSLKPRHGFVRGLSQSGFHKIAYLDWGAADDPRPIVCVHGLTRQGRDFDYLAMRLASFGRRVICPDLPGRGHSDWLANPASMAPNLIC